MAAVTIVLVDEYICRPMCWLSNCFFAAPIVNGNFTPHVPVMWTPPTYDDLMARDAAAAVRQFSAIV